MTELIIGEFAFVRTLTLSTRFRFNLTIWYLTFFRYSIAGLGPGSPSHKNHLCYDHDGSRMVVEKSFGSGKSYC